MFALVVALRLIVLHSVDGFEISINPAQVTSLHAAKHGEPNKLFTNEVRCRIGLTDGKFVTVRETCGEIRAMIKSEEPP